MEQQQQRLEVDIADLYALIGQLTVENRLLRARLTAAAGARPDAANGQAQWRDLEPAEAP